MHALLSSKQSDEPPSASRSHAVVFRQRSVYFTPIEVYCRGHARKYEVNYDWHQLGPTVWTEDSVVTLQADLHSYENGDAIWAVVSQWWSEAEKATDTEMFPGGEEFAYAGGCRFPKPVRLNEHHVTGWLVSQGQDAFDSIAHYAEELRRMVENVDPAVVVTWTELPHR